MTSTPPASPQTTPGLGTDPAREADLRSAAEQLSVSPRRPDETGAGRPDGRRPGGDVRADLADVAVGLGVQPRRARGQDARDALAEDGVVVMPATALEPGALASAAAELLGEHLRQLYPVRHRGADGDGLLDLHADSFHVVHDVHGVRRLERDPDEDHLLMLLTRAPDTGGGSVVVDAYRLVDRLAQVRPDLHAFMVGTELDLQGAWRDLPGVPASTRAGFLVEYTRTGRRVVRAGGGIRPMLRSAEHARSLEHLAELRDVAATAAAHAPRVHLEVGDVLALDNYRCWHGRDPFTGPRQLYVQTVRSAAAF